MSEQQIITILFLTAIPLLGIIGYLIEQAGEALHDWVREKLRRRF